jgi:hypothetical protein
MELIAKNYSMNFENKLEKILFNDSKNVINQLNDKNSKNRYSLFLSYAFAVSGMIDEELNFYKRELFNIYDLILETVDYKNDYSKLSSVQKNIHEYFKPKKHVPEISNVIMNYYGNCIGLTTIYSIFALKLGLTLELVTSNKGLHFFNKIITPNKEYYVDCTSKFPNEVFISQYYEKYRFEIIINKINYRDIKNVKLSDLLSAVYRSRAYKEKNKLKKIELYKKALIINPEDELIEKFILNMK